jgi:biofilm PGA synthesis N-glycosyltransferase PgaC
LTHPGELARALNSLYGERRVRPRGELRRNVELAETEPAPRADDVIAVAEESTGEGEGWLRRHYVRLHTRFILSSGAALLWAGLSVWFSLTWIDHLSRSLTMLGAVLLICGIAIVPGYLNVQIATALVLDSPPPLPNLAAFPPNTIVIAAYNEEGIIGETFEYATDQDYPGDGNIIVADDGSTDSTPWIVDEFAARNPRVQLLQLRHGGKAHALNAALATVETCLLATSDADTVLMPYALRRAVARLLASPPDTVAVAGAVFVRNSRSTFLARLQEWDYLLGIAAVKRQQALLQGTLVAQGSFQRVRHEFTPSSKRLAQSHR